MSRINKMEINLEEYFKRTIELIGIVFIISSFGLFFIDNQYLPQNINLGIVLLFIGLALYLFPTTFSK